MNNFFHIRTPMFGVAEKYGWEKGTWCLGLEKERIDNLAKDEIEVRVKYWENSKEYRVKAKKVAKYPIEQIKGYDKYVYIIPITILKEVSEDDKWKEFSQLCL